MSTTHLSLNTRDTTHAQPVSSLRYNWIAALLTCLSISGSYLDLWAHTHVPQLETFFTPWHGVLYGSFLLFASFMIGTVIVNHHKGHSWLTAIPVGYEFTLLGIFVFMVGGVGDMLWHIIFGIEKNIDALLSPTHLTLALGGFLMKTGPLLSAWRYKEQSGGWRELGPIILTITTISAGFMFFTWYANPFVLLLAAMKGPTSSEFLIQGLGIASILLQTALLFGPVLLVVKRWQLPFGALTLVFTLLQLAVSIPRNTYYLLAVALLAGLVADVLLKFLQPSALRYNQLHLFAFTAPVVLYLLYFLELQILTGVNWTIHMWLGSVFLAGIVGTLLSYLIVPPFTASRLSSSVADD